ncbi:MAG: recombination protein O N-terminal domain-containing protein [Paludibacteraceae bacterium]|nr:recombination protein O N-terminal domain-containing protein [Paludibacteraceae bacterium]
MYKTEGIVLAIQRKSDSASLVHIYTREYGKVLYMVYGGNGRGRKRSRGINRNILTPLSWLEIEGDELSGKSLHSMKFAQLHYVPQHLSFDVRRQCLAMFMAETLYKTLRHPLSDDRVFDYICNQIVELDTSDSIEHISSQFVSQLSELLGYGGEPLEEFQNLRSAALLNMLSTS